MLDNPALRRALSDDYESRILLTIEFDDTNLYFTDADVDTQYNGATFVSRLLNNMGNVKSTRGASINDLKLDFDGYAPSMLAVGLNDNWMNRRVTIEKLIKTDDFVGTLPMFKGYLTALKIAGDKLTFTTSSIWKDFEKAAGRKTNSASHKVRFPNSDPFEFTPNLIDSVPWGKRGTSK